MDYTVMKQEEIMKTHRLKSIILLLIIFLLIDSPKVRAPKKENIESDNMTMNITILQSIEPNAGGPIEMAVLETTTDSQPESAVVSRIESATESETYYIEEIPLAKSIQKHLYDTCKEYGVDYIEALAVMTVENAKYDPDLKYKNKNGSVDYGLFQINNTNRQWLREELGITNLLDPYQNIKAGVFIISELGSRFNGHKKYIAYNMGESGMKKYISRGANTTRYSRKVMETYEKLRNVSGG
jgi:soluble lytic murein transglycosylase-like protein